MIGQNPQYNKQNTQIQTQQISKNNIELANNPSINTLSSVKNANKSQNNGIFNFLNQRLSQWPIWNKITQFICQDKQSKVQENIKLHERTMRIGDLPWNMFMSRGGFGCEYQYYFCKQNGKTYFYQSSQSKQIRDFTYGKLFKQISKPPQNYKYQAIYEMPTKIAKPKIDQQKRTSFWN